MVVWERRKSKDEKLGVGGGVVYFWVQSLRVPLFDVNKDRGTGRYSLLSNK